MSITTVSSHVVSVNAIQGTLIADNAITAVHIATNAVSGTLIADNAVTATHIAQNTITVTQIADDAITAPKLADGIITTNHLNKAIISSQTEVTPVAGDFVLLGDTSDSNNLKKAPLTLLLNSNVDLSTKLNLSGGTMTGALIVTDGSTSAPSIGNSGDTNTGIYFPADDQLGLVVGGSRKLLANSTGITVNNGDLIVDTDKLVVDISSNKVGIGTNAPNQRLEVGGSGANIYLGNNSADTNFIHTGGCLGLSADTDIYITCDSNDTSSDPAPAGVIIFGGGSSTDTDSNLDFTEAEFGNNGAPRVEYARFHSNGFLGLNTIPGVELDIKRKTNAYPLRIGSSQGQGRAMVFADINASPTKYNWLVGAQYNIDNGFEITPSTAVGGYTFSTPSILVKTDGKVGIGETVPLAKLHVREGDSGQGTINSNFDQLCLEDDAHAGMTILSGNSSDGAIYFGDVNSNDIGQFKYKHGTNEMAFTQSGAETLLLSSTGAHYKGVNSYTLTINADTDNSGEDGVPTLDFKMDGTQTRLKVGVDASNLPYISTQSDIDLPLQIQTGTSGQNRVYINDTGMQIRKDGAATAPDHILHLVQNGTPLNDTTFISLQNGSGGGDTSTPESHIDFEFLDGNTNEYPQARITAGASTYPGLDANTQNLEGKGYIALATNDGSGTSGEVDPINRLVVTGDGNVGIGIDAPGAPLVIQVPASAVNAQINFQSGAYNSDHFRAYANQSGRFYIQAISNSSHGVYLQHNSTSWASASDERLKENIVELENVLPKIKDLRAVKYNFIADEENTTAIGFIAQDWQTDFSEVVSDSVPEVLGINYTETIPVLLKAIQELKVELDAAKARITTLEG